MFFLHNTVNSQTKIKITKIENLYNSYNICIAETMVFKNSIHEWTTNNEIQTCINDHVLFNIAAAIKKNPQSVYYTLLHIIIYNKRKELQLKIQ